MKDLSKVETSMTAVISNNWSVLNNMTTKDEVYKFISELFNNAGINTEASRRLLLNISKKRYISEVMTVIANSVLAGCKMKVLQIK